MLPDFLADQAWCDHPTLVIAAHPDDEILGCGGSIARLSDAGGQVHVAFLADGVGARREMDHGVVRDSLHQRRSAAAEAARIIGAATLHFDDFPDNRLDSVSLLDVVRCCEGLIEQYQPRLVLTHHAGDLNLDHRRVHQAVCTACRPQRNRPVRTLLAFEVASSTEWQTPGAGTAFLPNVFVDIGPSIERKLAALDAYTAELREWPHPRSRAGVEHLARWRGATVGCDAAEAFMLVRHLA
jgi:N-acetylglucosamine malate deacetylase 1